MNNFSLFSVGVAILLIITIFNFFTINELFSEVEKKKAEIEEANRLPVISLVLISPSECDSCFDVSPIVDAVRGLNYNLTYKEEGVDKASSYSVSRLPALVLSGEIDRLPSNLVNVFERRGDRLVFESPPPYYDLSEGRVVGKVSAVIIEDSQCQECFSFAGILSQLRRSMGMYIEERKVESTSEEGRRLIEKYSLTKVPILLLDKEADFYGFDQFASTRQQILTFEDNYALLPFPPYVDLDTGETRGLLDVIYLSDKNCKACLPVSFFSSGLRRMGLYMANETYLDVEDAGEVLSAYNISFVPTVIIRGDYEAYTGLRDAWSAWGVERNNALIFTNYDAIEGAVYVDVKSGAQLGEEVRVIEVNGSEFEFSPSTITLQKGERVRIIFRNVGSVPHNFVVDELGIRTPTIAPGRTAQVDFEVTKSGTFSFYCSVAGHREFGMEGNLTIS